MAIKTFTTGEVLTASDTNTYLANSGMVYVTSATIGTGVSTVTVSGAFSATYDQYHIIINGGTASTSDFIAMTLGATTTGYYEGRPGIAIPGGAYAGNITNNGGNFFVGQFTTTGKSMSTVLANPFLATETRHYSQGFSTSTSSCAYSSGVLNNTTSYTAFTLAANAGTWTGGTVTVYGFRKA
jgi:hypothetical protein